MVCSEAFLQKLLSELPPGKQWGAFETGGEFGYEEIYVHLSPYANAVAADEMAQAYCLRNGLLLANDRKLFSAYETDSRQKVILLYASGVCIGLMSLLILLSLLMLETEQEKRSFGILRAIGMSKRQMWGKVWGKAALRSLLAAAGGWLIYLSYAVLSLIKYEATANSEINHQARWISPLEALDSSIEHWVSLGCNLRLVLILTAICLFVSLAAALAAKRSLKKGAIEL